jgi:hypothetical protein
MGSLELVRRHIPERFERTSGVVAECAWVA